MRAWGLDPQFSRLPALHASPQIPSWPARLGLAPRGCRLVAHAPAFPGPAASQAPILGLSAVLQQHLPGRCLPPPGLAFRLGQGPESAAQAGSSGKPAPGCRARAASGAGLGAAESWARQGAASGSQPLFLPTPGWRREGEGRWCPCRWAWKALCRGAPWHFRLGVLSRSGHQTLRLQCPGAGPAKVGLGTPKLSPDQLISSLFWQKYLTGYVIT